MGTEDWIFKGTILITITKKPILKIQGRGQTLKNTILKNQNKIAKIIKKNIYIYEICFKNRVLFFAR